LIYKKEKCKKVESEAGIGRGHLGGNAPVEKQNKR
jgi:hypothetical protein